MTILIGMLCQDGVVIGADSSATFGNGQLKTVEQKVEKISIVENKIIVTGTGQVGLGQRFNYIVDNYYKQKGFTKHPQEIGRELSQLTIQNFSTTGVAKGQLGTLVAFSQAKNFYLCEFAIADFQPEFKTKDMWYVSMGSGQLIADPFLGLMRKVFWGDDKLPNLKEGIFFVTWALDHTIEVNPGGINGPKRIATLSLDTANNVCAKLLSEEELQEHEENVKAAEAHLREYKCILSGKKQAGDEDVPAIIHPTQ